MSAGDRDRAEGPFDFVVVGSGAGGGPLAARLAERGFRVLLLEAGPVEPPGSASPEVSLVPALHAASSEDDALSWRFFVRHYDRPPAGRDSKHHDPDPSRGEDDRHDGIFYPRASALGGCTVHNALITVAGPDADWDDLAAFLGDPSWRSDRMRPYFRRLERNEYLDAPTPIPATLLGRARDALRWALGFDVDHTAGRHGFEGWLRTSLAEIERGLADPQLLRMVKAALVQSGKRRSWRPGALVKAILRGELARHLDPNHSRTQAESPEGVVLVPMSACGERSPGAEDPARPNVRRGRRSGPRERLLEVRAAHPDRLVIRGDALATRVLFDDSDPPRAVGVEYLEGAGLYRANARPAEGEGTRRVARVTGRGEVVLCGGSFNTPQLLMLSGIGDPTHLAEVAEAAGDPLACSLGPDADGGPRRIALPGVGRNLQDRYEVTVISKMTRDFSALEGATFRAPTGPDDRDPHLSRWRADGSGLYASNGVAIAILRRSRPDLDQPDLFLFGMPLPFPGYRLGYSDVAGKGNFFTWSVLKGHTRNNGGEVRLRGVDPRETPLVNFHYFNERGRPGAFDDDPDLLALVDGVTFVREIARRAGKIVAEEVQPGPAEVPPGDVAKLKEWILREAWGHHACGSCRMGPDGDAGAVLDARFRVRGVAGLRVVDASIFPTIPGYFLATNIYMASEKAADVLAEDSRDGEETMPEYPRALRTLEAAAIARRREAARLDPMADAASPAVEPGPDPPGGIDAWDEGVTGLGLAGGEAFGLGVLQALARGDGLRRIDFLSTVDGGSRIGAFLGRAYDHLRAGPAPGGDGRPAPSRVARMLVDPASPEVEWLRGHADPDATVSAARRHAATLRNLLTVHLVVGISLLALFGLTNALRYGVFDPATAGLGLIAIGEGEMPIGRLVQSLLGPYFSPWFVAFEVIVLFLALPRALAYWVVSHDRPGRYSGPALAILFLLATALVVLGVKDGLSVAPLFLGLSLFSTLVHAELAWRRASLRAEASGTGGPDVQSQRTRDALTSGLALTLGIAGATLGLAAVDGAAHALLRRAAGDGSYAPVFATSLALLVALLMLLHLAARRVAPGRPPRRREAARGAAAGALAVLGVAALLVFWSFTSHAAYQGGRALGAGLTVTGLAALLTLSLGHPRAVNLLNRASPTEAEAARIGRAVLGAANPARRHRDAADAEEAVAGDDAATIADYRPHEAGGPLHILNLACDGDGNVASSPLAISAGRRAHAAWPGPVGTGGAVVPLGHEPGEPHPLVDVNGAPSRRFESPALRYWVATSAASTPPRRLSFALLLGLTNLRAGRWWDGGLTASDRDGYPRLGVARRLLYLVPRVFRPQALLISEWLGRYPGHADRYWHLSGGAATAGLGGYELIRRRVPRIILADGDAGGGRGPGALAALLRWARNDFGAELTPLSPEELDALAAAGHLDPARREALGTLEDLAPPPWPHGRHAGRPSRDAALFRVDYRDAPSRPSWLLYLRGSPAFEEGHGPRRRPPSRGAACWDEDRRRGERAATPLLADPAWFWGLPLPEGDGVAARPRPVAPPLGVA